MPDRHTRDGYFIPGEGIVGAEERRGTVPVDPAFRFSRIVPRERAGPQLDEPTLREIAAAMTAGGEPVESQIPAGYTYLGQFIAHDLTFDDDRLRGSPVTTRVSALGNARSPSLDLDSLYGRGPRLDPEYYAHDGVHLLTGMTLPVEGTGPASEGHAGFDLPRAGDGTALIPDPRNDENLLVAQTHAAFIRFHNRVADMLRDQGVPHAERFAHARERVVAHYQWMVRTDFLPRIVDPAIVTDVFAGGPPAFEVPPRTMPVEFSAAAYRLGHSMVRASYDLNLAGPRELGLMFTFSAAGGRLGGKSVLQSNWIADLRRFYDFREAGRPDLAGVGLNLAQRIDTRLVDPLARLPPESLPLGQTVPSRTNLAFRNLTRARMLGLATGQQMAELMREHLPNVEPLTPDEILTGDRGARFGTLTSRQVKDLTERTPLWFYVLREAELGTGKMRGVGGRLVAETFQRATRESRISILRPPAFRPTLISRPDRFGMADLLLFASEGKAALLNPLGD